MTDEQIALARRAVACRGWRWLPGMLTSDGGRVRAIWPSRIVWDYLNDFGSDHASTRTESVNVLPVLEDPATLGCLLALVREAMNDEHAGVSWDLSGEEWVCDGEHVYNGKTYIGVFAQGPSYAEALVAALEAAREAAP